MNRKAKRIRLSEAKRSFKTRQREVLNELCKRSRGSKSRIRISR